MQTLLAWEQTVEARKMHHASRTDRGTIGVISLHVNSSVYREASVTAFGFDESYGDNNTDASVNKFPHNALVAFFFPYGMQPLLQV
mmetsp:Transcript_10760/g.18869  ORF Transcript_10760/g.18869 Transcript_10760/m.18869 type:complete len:86 (-) Transcript_10760:1118-1375(-)